MKKYILLMSELILIFLIGTSFVQAKEILKECNYLCTKEDCTEGYGGKVVFYDNNTSKVFISDASVPSGSAALMNKEAANGQFDIDGKCPSYFVRYANFLGLGPKFYVLYNATDLEEWKNKTSSTITIKWAPLVSKEYEDGSNIDANNIATYVKTYNTISTNTLGILQFILKYDLTNDYSRGAEVTIAGKKVSLVYDSLDDFVTDIVDPVRNDEEWPELYCGELTAYLSLKSSAVLISGYDKNNGTIVCSPNKSLFNDGTNKLVRYQLPKTLPPENEPEEEIPDPSENEDEPDDDVPEIHYPDYKIDNSATLANTCSSPSFRKPMKFIGIILNFVKIIIPIIIIAFGVLDLYKAVTANKDDGLKKSIRSIAIRVIAGVFIFLLPGIIQFVLNMVNEWSDYKNVWCCCTDCLLNPDCDVNTCSSDSCHIEGTN